MYKIIAVSSDQTHKPLELQILPVGQIEESSHSPQMWLDRQF